MSELEGKDINEVIADGMGKLASMPSGENVSSNLISAAWIDLLKCYIYEYFNNRKSCFIVCITSLQGEVLPQPRVVMGWVEGHQWRRKRRKRKKSRKMNRMMTWDSDCLIRDSPHTNLYSDIVCISLAQCCVQQWVLIDIQKSSDCSKWLIRNVVLGWPQCTVEPP